MNLRSPKEWLKLLKEAFAHWNSHKAARLGAALSYYAIFSLAPLLIIVISIAGLFLDPNVATQGASSVLQSLVGPQSGAFIASLLAQSHSPGAGIAAALTGLFALVLGASGMLAELKASLDDFWEAGETARKHTGLAAFFRSRLVTLAVIPVLVGLLFVSLLFSAFLAAASSRFILSESSSLLLRAGNGLFTLLAVGFLFAFVYRFLPDTKLPWRETLLGGGISSLLFALGKSLIAFYLANIANTSSFGAAGALIALMVWIYYSVQIFLFGASLIYVYSQDRGYLKKRAR